MVINRNKNKTRQLFNLLLCCFFTILWTACKPGMDDEPKIHSVKPDPPEKISYDLVKRDSFFFRRAYHDHHLMEGTARDSFMNRNPDLISAFDSEVENDMYEGLIHQGFIRNGALNLQAIDTLPFQFRYHFSKNHAMQVNTVMMEPKNDSELFSYILKFYDHHQKILTDTLFFDFPPEVTFIQTDLNNDGKNEIGTLYKWYIINGDNYELQFYELQAIN